MADKDEFQDRLLSLGLARVSEAAALASAKLIGRGDEKAADQAAVNAMRDQLNLLDIAGVVVIGEGERDEAPMLYIGEKVGAAQDTGPKIDIALDPLEGTTITAKAGPNALAVLACAEEGNLLNAPDVYMDKLAVGPGYPEGIIDLAKTPTENVKAVAAAKGVRPDEIIVCVLDRPRHAELIAELRGLGCGVVLIGDGDVAGVIAVTNPETTIDLYMGSGGAFDAAIAGGDAPSLETAVSVYRGPLLEGCVEEWVLVEREARLLAMINLAAAAVFLREQMEVHLEGTPRRPVLAPPAQPRGRSWIRRVASGLTRRTEEPWPRRRSK